MVQNIPERRLREFLDNTYWYQTIRLPNEWVTKGTYDHSPYLDKYGFPESLKGKQVLDVGASDGHFSFEFERRGAKKVVAIDTNLYDGSLAIDPSPVFRNKYAVKYSNLYGHKSDEFADILQSIGLSAANNFLILKHVLKSSVEFRNYSIYDLASLGEKYDIVFCGDLIEHLKNPLAALENLAAVTEDLCIISLSNALPSAKLGNLCFKMIRRIIRILGWNTNFIEASEAIKYTGFVSGGSFFHFGLSAFRDALLASGFNSVRIYSEFDIRNMRHNTLNHHIIFHCKVAD
jgi:2-polyprenyl-3-methyl-5-hydroxy-6-metoxy-1,4-benzoquinol methylase